MPIYDQPSSTAAAVLTNKELRQIALRVIDGGEQSYERAIKLVFEHETLTPQEVADELGTDGGDFVAFFNGLKAFIEARTSRTLTPVSNYGSIAVNGNGTITITLN